MSIIMSTLITGFLVAVFSYFFTAWRTRKEFIKNRYDDKQSEILYNLVSKGAYNYDLSKLEYINAIPIAFAKERSVLDCYDRLVNSSSFDLSNSKNYNDYINSYYDLVKIIAEVLKWDLPQGYGENKLYRPKWAKDLELRNSDTDYLTSQARIKTEMEMSNNEKGV